MLPSIVRYRLGTLPTTCCMWWARTERENCGEARRRPPGTLWSTTAVDCHLIGYCFEIANSVKHVVVTRHPKFPDVSTHTVAVFDPPFVATAPPQTLSKTKMCVEAVIDVEGTRYPVIELFEVIARDWDQFLDQEGQYRPYGED